MWGALNLLVGPEAGERDTKKNKAFLPCCLSLDLEVGREDSRIHAFAGVRADTGQRMVFRASSVESVGKLWFW